MDRVKEIIEYAGWYENRSINIDYMLEDFMREGYPAPNDVLISFLKEFSNLKIEFQLESGFYVEVRINTELACGLINIKDVETLEKILGDHLLPVGALNEFTPIILTYSGKFYICFEEEVIFVGNSLFELVKNAFQNLGD